ncbi:Flavodoxin [Prevotella sp. tc2-28]|uniref:cyclophilin-like fold protein n=1 Tax=Prevotella sp. tc2-28 TaxID=1761888 RepID=UPI00089CE387|nr:cyclophilin-like fold protein [Prevotella sp. tc2-28]SEA27804.1 Flavodoxin [Prevotella sp. tc2-28]
MKRLILFLSAMLSLLSTDATAKTLVVYYSYTGNCREIVNTLTSQIEADVLEIQPAEKGLRYEANNYALGTQLLNAIKANPNNASSYPAIDPVTTSLSDYQNVIIVTPLWWSQMAAIMQSYLFQRASQMAGKHVGMIVSSASSGISDVVSDAERLLPHVTWMGEALWINASNHGNRASLIEDWLKTLNFDKAQTTMDKMYITIGGQTQSVTLVDNDATRELVAALQSAPITVTLNDNNFEIWGALGRSLTTKNEQMTALPGDIVLYNGSNICIFYDSNSWSYTRLGHIDGLSESELRTFLKAGQNNISVTLSLTSGTTAIKSVNGNRLENGEYYSLNGVKVENPSKGIYVKNGKKVIL